MTIHFSPYYDTGVWSGEPAKGECRNGEAFVGPLGLLDQLELRLGLTSRPVPPYITLKHWITSLERAQEGHPRFYENSLLTDRLGTAIRLLEWRDVLVVGGWSSEYDIPTELSRGAQTILHDLSVADEIFRNAGGRTVSDRWRKVMAAIPSSSIVPEAIAVDVLPDTLEPLWQKLLILLENEGWTVAKLKFMPTLPADIEVLHFKDYADACAWMACRDDRPLAITKDGFTLEMALKAAGKASIAAETSASCHLLGHLFQDALRLLEPGVNRDTIVSYLSVTEHPLNKYSDKGGKHGLRIKLLNHILRQGGFGEDTKGRTFDEIVSDYDIPVEDRAVWIPAENKQESVSVSAVLQICDHFKKWVAGESGDLRTSQQLNQIKDACEALPVLLRELGYGDTVPVADFRHLLAYVCPAESFSWSSAAVGSLSVAPGPCTIAADCKEAVWLDCASDVPTDKLPFLSPADIAVLHSDLNLPSREETIKQADACCRASLARVHRLVIAYCDKIGTASPDKHPVLIEVAGARDREGKVQRWLDELPYEWPRENDMTRVPFVEVESGQNEFEVGAGKLQIPDSFSPSSIELLLDRPFDYAVRYILNLYDEREDLTSTVQGLVAHLVIHKLIMQAQGEGASCTAADLDRVFSSSFEAVFDMAVREQGLALLLPENSLLIKDFKRRLKVSALPMLIKILRQNSLTIMGSEVPCRGEISCGERGTRIRLNAIIDLVLQDVNGNLVVFDFKWHSKGAEKERKASIAKGTDYQLILYRALVEQGYAKDIPPARVVDMSFYMLRSAVLYTASERFRKDELSVEVVERSKSPDESLNSLFEEFDGAISQIREGILEVTKKEDYGENHVLKGKLN